MNEWKNKANRIIEELCTESYNKANKLPNGQRYRKHRPYAVPETAQILVECLRNGDEYRAKLVFIELAYLKI